MGSQLAALAQKQGDKVVVLKVDIDKERAFSQSRGVSGIPDMRLMYDGKVIERMIGYRPVASLEKLVLAHEQRLPNPPRLEPVSTKSPEVPKPPAFTVQPSEPSPGGGSVDQMEKDWLPPGVTPAK